MQVLVDSSVWIDYFREGKHSDKLEYFIDENLICINDFILAELVPFLQRIKQKKLISLLNLISKLTLNIVWDQIIEFHYKCIKKGINGVGVPDLIIAQNAKQNGCGIYTLDQHFSLVEAILSIEFIH